jgi:hypothetical protein
LEAAGFSKKDEVSGLDSNNLSELVEKNPNISLEATIIHNQFIQKIEIEGGAMLSVFICEDNLKQRENLEVSSKNPYSLKKLCKVTDLRRNYFRQMPYLRRIT